VLAEFGENPRVGGDGRRAERKLQQEVVVINLRNAFIEADRLRQAAPDQDGRQRDVGVGPDHDLDESSG
jgi:hypothetical protein